MPKVGGITRLNKGGLGLETSFSLSEEIRKRKEELLPDFEIIDFEDEEEENDDVILSELLDDIIINQKEEITEEIL